MTLAAIDEAVTAGARVETACEVAGIDARTVQRWRGRPDEDDQRRGPRTRPSNQLTPQEEAEIIALATSAEFRALSPHQLVAKLADLGIYVASESSVYRLLRRKRLLQHRDRTKPRTHRRPQEHVATRPNQVWAWYRPGYPERPFASLDAARAWVAGFVAWYNDDHQHSGIRFVTPSERHDGREAEILAHRHQVYLAARDRNPERWTRHTRNWTPVATVRLNPEHGRDSRSD